jgi:hypothetical protein
MNAKMITYASGGTWTDGCELVLRGDTIVVSYEGETGPVIYMGKQTGQGHYNLSCPEKRARATLHRWPDDGLTFEGSWVEDGEFGMRQVEIDEDEV